MRSVEASSSIVLSPEQYALMVKDVLYARKTQIGLEIGEVIIEGEKNATV